MKKIVFLFSFCLILFHFSKAQVYPKFDSTGLNEGRGTFTNAALSNFSWIVTGSLAKPVQILNNEVFDDGNAFENNFGQANNEDNLRIKINPNGSGTAGMPIVSKARLTINFDEVSLIENWGFCVVDIEVENCLISAIDENNNKVSNQDINKWLVELFDANLVTDSINIPKWDSLNAALLGSNTPVGYTTYDSLVIGGMPDSEAASAFFMPNIPLKTLMIDYENLQQGSSTSYHFYIASDIATSLNEVRENTIAVYPNPTNAYINVELPYLTERKSSSNSIVLYNLMGEIVLQVNVKKGNFKLDVSHLEKGIYYMKVVLSQEAIIKKIIIE